jgi:hypothetical protein
MASPLHEICAARLPADQLPAVAEIRCLRDVRVALVGGAAWVRWEPGDDAVLRQVLPVAGVQLYFQRAGHWFRPGQHLPAFEVPADADYRPLHAVLTPAPVQPLPPPTLDLRPVALTLVAADRPRPTTALACCLAELDAWADTVPSPRLAALHAAHCGGRVLLLGKRLPLLPSGERFWGEKVLVPLGYRPEPDLPEAAIHEALGLGAGELLFLRPEKFEVVSRLAFQSLTRAGLRLARREGAP